MTPTDPEYDLDRAYEIDGPDSARTHYDDWSATYDAHFADGWGYVAPARIAALFAARADASNTPVLDIGAGTGLVAEALPPGEIDGIDISAGMLEKARAKGRYSRLFEANLLAPLPVPDGSYGGFVSCGTFTHGHVGPASLPELLRIARPGALFACGTIAPVYDGMGFGSALARLVAAGRITPVDFAEIEIYEGRDHPHAADRGLVMLFRKR